MRDAAYGKSLKALARQNKSQMLGFPDTDFRAHCFAYLKIKRFPGFWGPGRSQLEDVPVRVMTWGCSDSMFISLLISLPWLRAHVPIACRKTTCRGVVGLTWQPWRSTKGSWLLAEQKEIQGGLSPIQIRTELSLMLMRVCSVGGGSSWKLPRSCSPVCGPALFVTFRVSCTQLTHTQCDHCPEITEEPCRTGRGLAD